MLTEFPSVVLILFGVTVLVVELVVAAVVAELLDTSG